SLRFMGLVRPAEQAGALIDLPFRPLEAEKVYEEVGQSAARQVVQSGMDAAVNAARKDPRAVGWARVTQGGGACYFGSMLAVGAATAVRCWSSAAWPTPVTRSSSRTRASGRTASRRR